MVRPRADVFFATRDIVLAGGVLHKFIKLKFPSLKRDFEADPGLLERYVKYVQIDHLVSSGADFDENLWYGASASDELFRVPSPGHPQKLVSTQARFQGPQPIFWGGHGDAAEARPRPPLRLGAGDGAFQRHRRELCGRLEALRSVLPARLRKVSDWTDILELSFLLVVTRG